MRRPPLVLVVSLAAACSSGVELAGTGTATTAARSDHAHADLLPKGATRACTDGKVVSAIGDDGSVTCSTPGGPSAGLGTGLKSEAGKTALDTAYTDARYTSVLIDAPSGTTTVSRDPTRWVIRTTFNPAFAGLDTASATRKLDAARLASYCADEDGCTVTLAMVDYGTEVVQQVAASNGPHHFAVNPTSGAWRIAAFVPGGDEVNSSLLGIDGDGQPAHVLRAWNCYFTDAHVDPGSSTSTDAAGSGWELLSYNLTTEWKASCQLTIDD